MSSLEKILAASLEPLAKEIARTSKRLEAIEQTAGRLDALEMETKKLAKEIERASPPDTKAIPELSIAMIRNQKAALRSYLVEVMDKKAKVLNGSPSEVIHSAL
jgi:hypothetical protein